MRYIILGDIHGCLEELLELLDLIELKPDDIVVSLGDLLHKGPESAEVVKLLRQMEPKTILIQGNHEEKHLRWHFHDAQHRKLMSHTDEYAAISDQLTQEDVDFLLDSYYWYRLPGNNLCVHGGISPRWGDLHAPLLSKHLHISTPMSSKDRRDIQQVLRIRAVDPDGKMLSMDKIAPFDPHWSEDYDGRWGRVFFGHEPWLIDQPRQFNHALGIDLGVAIGGHLCAYLLDSEGNDLGYATVKARMTYAQPHGNTYGI